MRFSKIFSYTYFLKNRIEKLSRLFDSFLRLQLLLNEKEHKCGPDFKYAALTIFKGSFNKKIKKEYLLGSVIGALIAKYCGFKKIVLIEFGVATGKGFISLLEIAELLEKYLNMQTIILGFDNRDGLPKPVDYRDLPHVWGENQFEMGTLNYKKLDKISKSKGCSLIIGDIKDTLKDYDFNKKHGNNTALAFCSIDVDYYSSTLPIIKWIEKINHKNSLPSMPIYLDDIFSWSDSNNAGEMLAIKEFNERSNLKKIEVKIPSFKIFSLYNFDNPISTGEKKIKNKLEIGHDYLKTFCWL